jgi:hypothetical protein
MKKLFALKVSKFYLYFLVIFHQNSFINCTIQKENLANYNCQDPSELELQELLIENELKYIESFQDYDELTQTKNLITSATFLSDVNKTDQTECNIRFFFIKRCSFFLFNFQLLFKNNLFLFNQEIG